MIQAIETRYNGYRFRSRIEARWAVFFDALGVRYEYEPQGFGLQAGRYLPDFWIPDQDCYIEIKGKEPTGHEELLASQLSVHTRKNVYIFFGDIPSPDDPYRDFCDSGSSYAYFGNSGNMMIKFEGAHVEIPYLDLNTETAQELTAVGMQFAELQMLLSEDNVKVYLTQKHLERHLSKAAYADIEAWCCNLNIGNYRVSYLDAGGGCDTPYAWSICPDCGRIGIGFSGWSERVCSCKNAYKNGYDNPRLVNAYRAARSARFEHGETPKVPRGKPRG